MPRKKRDPGEGITISRYRVSDVSDGVLFNRLAKTVLGIEARFDLCLIRKGDTTNE